MRSAAPGQFILTGMANSSRQPARDAKQMTVTRAQADSQQEVTSPRTVIVKK
jgi:hypothetical protein